jgi:hypothetical protein
MENNDDYSDKYSNNNENDTDMTCCQGNDVINILGILVSFCAFAFEYD